MTVVTKTWHSGVLAAMLHQASPPSAHVDRFVLEHLPPADAWPVLDYSSLPELADPAAPLNCAVELLQHPGDRAVMWCQGNTLTYGQLQAWTNQLAVTLVQDLSLTPGQRVLLRGFNSPWLFAAWLAVLKAGGIVVTTMPLLRARELSQIVDKAAVGLALCDARLADELESVDRPGLRKVLVPRLEALAAHRADRFEAVETLAGDPCLIAFTSGTTGQPKGAVHSHRDVLAMCDTFARHVLQPTAEDVFAGSPPVAFTYGLGGLLTFPFRVGASTALLETVTPAALLQLIRDARVTTLSTSPTMYRALLDIVDETSLASLRTCVSAGEPLPLATFEAWRRKTDLTIVDGLGATEMLHIFISAAGTDVVPGSTGKIVPGYQAAVMDDHGNPLPPGHVGKLAVRGPTGCRYLDDPERQRQYVRDGWNYTGDAYLCDEAGYFWFQARADDMIISAGYNIAGPEIENVLLEHPKVKECGVVAAPDAHRGHVVKAYIVLRDAADAGPELVHELQDYVKSQIAPYKYPRQIEFLDALPRTETGKLQRFKLRQLAEA